MHARLPVQEHSAVFASLYVHILDISVLPPEKKRCQSESSLCIILLMLPICGCEVKILHLFELFMHFSEVRQNVAEPFCLSVHTLLSIINECTKVLFKHVLYFNFILEKLNWPMPHLALHELHNLSISSQKFILPPVVRENTSQTPRPASGLQWSTIGQIFLPLLDFFLTPRKRALADTQTRLSVHVHGHICHSLALCSTPALMIRIYLPWPLPLHLSLCLPALNAKPRAGHDGSLLKLRLLATRQHQCSVSHIFTNRKRKWGIHTVCCVARFDLIIYWPLNKFRVNNIINMY